MFPSGSTGVDPGEIIIWSSGEFTIALPVNVPLTLFNLMHDLLNLLHNNYL